MFILYAQSNKYISIELQNISDEGFRGENKNYSQNERKKKKNFVKTVLTEIRKRANNNFSSADLSIYCVHYKNFKDFKYIFFK